MSRGEGVTYQHRDRESGLALVSVLWALTLLSLIAAVILGMARQSSYLEHYQAQQLVRRSAFDALLHRSILGLLDKRPDQRWHTDAVPQSLKWQGFEAVVKVQDELGKIDLNSADDELIRGLFRSLNLSAAEADQMADRVLDWRSTTGLKRLNGSDESDYRVAGSPIRPRGAPFQSIDEVRLVLGMSDDLYRQIVPAITVYSQKATIDPQVAPREALLALPGFDSDKADRQLAVRSQLITEGNAGSSQPSSATIMTVPMTGRAYTIAMTLKERDKLFTQTVVIRITDEQKGRYWILAIE